MIKLRLVGSSSDLESLVLSSKPRGKKGSHRLPVDEKLLQTLEDMLRRRRQLERGVPAAPARPQQRQQPKIPPSEIQRLLRSGRTPSDVSRLADVSERYVQQFYTPVLYERAGIIRDAQGAVLEKARLGVSRAPLGEAVARNLRQRRVRMSSEDFARRWDATRSNGQPWSVTFTFNFRGKERRALWKFDPQTRRLSAGNAVAADVGWVADARGSAPSFLPAVSDDAPRAKRGRGRKRTAAARRPKRSAPKRSPERRTTARRPAKRAAPTRRTAAKRATPKRRTAAKRSAPKRRATAKRSTPKRRTAAKRRPAAKRRASARSRRR